MSENCNHDCSSCSEQCNHKIQKKELNELSSVKKVIAVVSGKGGVGKSLVTSLLASAMNKEGKRTAVLDADITGPSIPKLFGIKEKAMSSELGLFPARAKNGTEVMSVNILLQNETDPVLWRGPVIAGAVEQFWSDVIWTDIDYMFVDMPPGTGDVALTVFQSLPVDGIIIVTSPQELVSMIVEKAANMAEMMEVPILGIVENMSYFECPDCGKKHTIFGNSNIEEIATAHNIDTISKLPIKPEITKLCDEGKAYEIETDSLAEIVDMLKTL